MEPTEEFIKNDTLDLRGVKCPINYVKASLKLEEMNEGEILELILDDGMPMANVPNSIEGDGHKILKIDAIDEGRHYRLLIQKGG